MSFNAAQATKDVVVAASLTASAGTAISGTLDTAGFDYVTLRTNIGLIANNTNATAQGTKVVITHSDDTNSSNYVSITGFSDITGLTRSCEVLQHLDMRNKKRYVQIATTVGTSAVSNEAGYIGTIATLGRGENKPASTSDMVNTTNDKVVVG